jgi:hypothetical protein
MKHGGAPHHVSYRADVESGQVLIAGLVIEHGHSSQLHDAVWIQIDGLKRAEVPS